MLPYLWPFEVVTLFGSFFFLALMFVFPVWGMFALALLSGLAFYGLVQLRAHLEEVAR